MAGTAGSFTFKAGQVDLLATDEDTLQLLQCIFRHAFRQLNGAVVIVQADIADVAAADIGFVGDSANNVLNLNAIAAANFETVDIHLIGVGALTTTTALAAFSTIAIMFTLWACFWLWRQDQWFFFLCQEQQS